MSFTSTNRDEHSLLTNSGSFLDAESTLNSTANLTDITGDKTFLIDLTTPAKRDRNLNSESNYGLLSGRDHNMLPSNMDFIKGEKGYTNQSKDDSVILIDMEDGSGDNKKPNDSSNKRKHSLGDDSELVLSYENSLHSSDPSDISMEEETATLNNSHISDISSFERQIAELDKNLPDTVRLLRTADGGRVYVVGTAHFSTESQEDVSKIIQIVQPQVVLVELCSQRVNILELDEETILREAKNIDFQKIRQTVAQNGVFNGIMYILLLNMSAHITRQLGKAPGGEFRRALFEAKKVPYCIIHLGDRPIQITLQRALASLSWWQTARLMLHLLTSKDPISPEEVERCKRSDLIQEMLAEMAGEFPALGKVFVDERDVYLTHSLQMAALANAGKPAHVVGVVGIGHMPGIMENWGKVQPHQIPPLMRIPPPSLSGRIVKASLKLACFGVVVYAGYKLLPRRLISSFTSS